MGGVYCVLPKGANQNESTNTLVNDTIDLAESNNNINSSSALFESSRSSFLNGKGYTRDITRHSTKEVSVEDFKILRVIG